MCKLELVEVKLPTADCPKSGVILHEKYRKTPLWIGESTYNDVFQATRGEIRYYDDEDGELQATFGIFTTFPLWALWGDEAKATAHLYYFDDEKILQGVVLKPANWMTIQIGDERMTPMQVDDSDKYFAYMTFDILIVRIRSTLDRILKVPHIMKEGRGLYYKAGVFFHTSGGNTDLLFSIALFSQDYLHLAIEEWGLTEAVDKWRQWQKDRNRFNPSNLF